MLIDHLHAEAGGFNPQLFLPLCQWAAENDALPALRPLRQVSRNAKATWEKVTEACRPTLHLRSDSEWRAPVFPLLNIHSEASIRRLLVDLRRYATLEIDTEMPPRMAPIVPRLQTICRKMCGSDVLFPRVSELVVRVYDTGIKTHNPRFASDEDLGVLCAAVSPRHFSLTLLGGSTDMDSEAMDSEEVSRLAKDLRLAIDSWRKKWPHLESVTLHGVPLADVAAFTTPGVRNNLYAMTTPTPTATRAGTTSTSTSIKAFVDGLSRGMVDSPAGAHLWRDEHTSWRIHGAVEELAKLESGARTRPGERDDLAERIEKETWEGVWWQIVWDGPEGQGRKDGAQGVDQEMVKRMEMSGRLKLVVDYP